METYISIDIEANGPIPGTFSMLAFGAVAFDQSGKEIGEYGPIKLLERPHAAEDVKTMAWWAEPGQKTAYEWIMSGERLRPQEAMKPFVEWLKTLKRPVFIGYPITYDFMFMYWYCMNYVGECPAGFSGLDIKTYAMASMGSEYKASVKGKMPKHWLKGLPTHTHNPLDDAREQGQLFFRIRDDKSFARDDARHTTRSEIVEASREPPQI